MKLARLLFQIVVLLSVLIAAHLSATNASWRSTPIGVGDVAPDFTLEDQNGHKIALADARGQNPVVLVFYRGYW